MVAHQTCCEARAQGPASRCSCERRAHAPATVGLAPTRRNRFGVLILIDQIKTAFVGPGPRKRSSRGPVLAHQTCCERGHGARLRVAIIWLHLFGERMSEADRHRIRLASLARHAVTASKATCYGLLQRLVTAYPKTPALFGGKKRMGRESQENREKPCFCWG